MIRSGIVFMLSAFLLGTATASSADNATSYTRQQDVIYKRTYGTALTMDIFEPKDNANGATVIWVLSGGWFSDHGRIKPEDPNSPIQQLLARGYRVCAVVHGSNPLFTAEDAVADIQRAVRYARHTALEDGATTVPIGIIGGSAGGHLSLMAGTTGDDGDKDAKDPVERVSSRVQAVACFYPPTDFLNYGKPGQNGAETTLKKGFQAAFQFRRYNEETRTLERVKDVEKKQEILKDISPVNHVTADDAPVFIIHGDADKLVPIQQAEIFVEKMKDHGVSTELVRRPGQGHGWPNIAKDYQLLYDWLDKHLVQK